MKRLPIWALTSSRPAFYDSESATAIEQTAKVYGAMQELIDEYNAFAERWNTQIEEFEAGVIAENEAFGIALRQEFQDFIDVVELKLAEMDRTISTDVLNTIKSVVDEMRDNGELLEAFNEELDVIDKKVNTLISEIETTINNFITNADSRYAPNGYGLGGFNTIVGDDVDIDTIDKNGFYTISLENTSPNKPMDHCSLDLIVNATTENLVNHIAFIRNYNIPIICVRKKSSAGWSEWHFINPPLSITGSEYATTKRHNNDVVYTKLIKHTMTSSVGLVGTLTNFTLNNVIPDDFGCLVDYKISIVPYNSTLIPNQGTTYATTHTSDSGTENVICNIGLDSIMRIIETVPYQLTLSLLNYPLYTGDVIYITLEYTKKVEG